VVNQQVFRTAGILVAVLAFILIVILTWRSLGDLEAQSRISGLDVARSAAARAVMQCYALEGAYPPQYLVDNYGLLADLDKYVYQYEPVAGNIHPIIGVRFPGSVDE